MTTTIVFVHGRGQDGRDPARLERKWRAGLATGLIQAGLPALSATPVAFPYYGNALLDATTDAIRRGVRLNLELPGGAAHAAADPEDVPFDPSVGPDVREIERGLLADLAASADRSRVPEEGLDDLLSWRPARRVLEWLARRTRVDREIIKSLLRDVAVYLTVGRDRILTIVRESVPPTGPVVLVSHSLGTVVAHDLLQDAVVRERVALWVTAGSPLGLRTVQRNLLAKGTRHPGVRWLTTYDANDIVALGHPLTGEWDGPIDNVAVENGDEPHAIERYLGHPPVAVAISNAVNPA
jgi:hypothetical protein